MDPEVLEAIRERDRSPVHYTPSALRAAEGRADRRSLLTALDERDALLREARDFLTCRRRNGRDPENDALCARIEAVLKGGAE